MVNEMIKRNHLARIWRRTLIHLVVVDAVGVAILISLILERARTSSGLSYLILALCFVVLVIANAILYFAMRSVRDYIDRKVGED